MANIQIVKENQLRDTLHNAAAEVCHTEEHRIYARGIVVGVVGAFMACGDTFTEAINRVKAYAPELITPSAVPQPWVADWFVKVKEN